MPKAIVSFALLATTSVLATSLVNGDEGDLPLKRPCGLVECVHVASSSSGVRFVGSPQA